MPEPTPADQPISRAAMARALGNPIRWSILEALFATEALAATQLAKAVGHTPTVVSKHLRVLVENLVVEHWLGRVYRIPPRFRVPGEPMLDFGRVLLRMKPAQ